MADSRGTALAIVCTPEGVYLCRQISKGCTCHTPYSTVAMLILQCRREAF